MLYESNSKLSGRFGFGSYYVVCSRLREASRSPHLCVSNQYNCDAACDFLFHGLELQGYTMPPHGLQDCKKGSKATSEASPPKAILDGILALLLQSNT